MPTIRLILISLFGLFLSNGDVWAAGEPAPTAKTGQTTSYDTRDDGALQKGVAWPDPRFTDNGNGTVTDNLTGLFWLKNANCFGTRQWSTALEDANGLANGSCDLTDGSVAGDWRLPSLNELESLVNAAGHPFTGVQTSSYWSSTTYASSTSGAWYVNLYDGYVYYNDKTNNNYVWPVRGGQ